ncbi:hypothetical protein [Jiangella anatolica]|nr:hypothetical protein [Jiangella anatolica]
MPGGPVDMVVSWVSGDDREWLRARRAALGHPDPDRFDESDIRFRDWGLLRYWFRSVEENAPWVRTVHLLTETRPPAWLNTLHPKLRVVNGWSLNPDAPRTFNSHAAEACLHRIPGLAERFVYLNDDFYLTTPLGPEFFFPGGLPYADPMPMLLTDGDVHAHAVLNASGIVNQHFTLPGYRRAVLSRGRGAGLRRDLDRALRLTRSGRVPPVTDHHLATPLLKSVVRAAFEAAGAAIEGTRRSVLRSREDVAPVALATHWHVATGRFSWVPHEHLGRYVEIGADPLERIEDALFSPVPQVCVNDGRIDEVEEVRTRVLAMFAERWPEPSSFELADPALLTEPATLTTDPATLTAEPVSLTAEPVSLTEPLPLADDRATTARPGGRIRHNARPAGPAGQAGPATGAGRPISARAHRRRTLG